MELLFGNQVRAGGRRIGYLAGVELDVASGRLTKIIFSDDGKLASHAQTRPVEGVRVERGHVVLPDIAATAKPPVPQPFLLNRAVRVTRAGRQAGHLVGVVAGSLDVLEEVLGRQHWWSGRFRLAASGVKLQRLADI
jgi:hypothetical protein